MVSKAVYICKYILNTCHVPGIVLAARAIKSFINGYCLYLKRLGKNIKSKQNLTKWQMKVR